jgi:hypothetical protein
LAEQFGFTVAGTAPEFRRLPFEPPPPDLHLWAAPWSAALLGVASTGCQIEFEPINEGRMITNHSRLIALLCGIVGAAALRLVPHPPNFSPIDAMALFSGAYLGRRALAFVAPLGALLMSDLVLGFYHGQATVYFSVALIVMIGTAALTRRSALRVGGAAVASSILFFVVTNFGMWLFSGIYPRTFVGLEACYVAAVPFFRNTFAGDLFYATLLFGGFRVAELLVPKLAQGTAQPA